MNSLPSSSLVISTYNRKDALELTLMSALAQKIMPKEIIVADDGSREDTRFLIESLKAKLKVPLHHVWHEDNGFQLAKIRNRAVAKANSEYIISIDGDQVLHPCFVLDHLEMAKRGAFLQGHRVLLNEPLTQKVIAEKQINVSLFDSGVSNKKNAIHSPFLRNLLAHESEKLRGVRGCNMSFWKNDLRLVNGFNEAFVGWGREDSELVLRLFHSGIKRVDLRFSAIAYHLYHPENSRNDLSKNDEELERAQKEKRKFCEKGLNQYET